MQQTPQRTSHSVRFTTSSGLTLAGTIDAPDSHAPRAGVVFAHHFAGSRQSPAASRICKSLADQGFHCLRFDFPGLGSSEGSFPDSSLTEYTENVVTAAQWLKNKCAHDTGHQDLPLILLGHSLGGNAVVRAAPHLENVQAVVTIGTPFTPGHTIVGSSRQGETPVHAAPTHTSTAEDMNTRTSTHHKVTLGGYEIAISDSFVKDLQSADMSEALRHLDCPLLILHSDTDDIVPISDAELIFKEAQYPKSFLDLHGSDHLLAHKGSAHHAAQLIALWYESLQL